MTPPRSLGLALSGGGFRAAAFHLGVLKRLREIGLLENVKYLSTVSGGSIVGAAWVNWQALRGDTIHDQDKWDQFENHFIAMMHGGLRGRLFWFAFALPLIAVFAVLVSVLLALDVAVWNVATISAGIAALIAYCFWHYFATSFLVWQYDLKLFNGTTIEQLNSDQAPGLPQLLVNATSLNGGEQVIFVPVNPIKALLLAWLPRIVGSPKTRVAVAVAASSALPGVFTPLRTNWVVASILREIRSLMAPMGFGGVFEESSARTYLTADGGVFDNQGIQALLDESCSEIIVSDAAATLPYQKNPTTWQFLPFATRRGVVFRCQDIIFGRVRDLGYKLLETQQALFRLYAATTDHLTGDDWRKLNLAKPILEDYVFVDLKSTFLWRERGSDGLISYTTKSDSPRLPHSIMGLMGTIRTDLDRFSLIEISALMFHGYTLIDHYIRQYQPRWTTAVPMHFHSSKTEINIDWANLTDATVTNPIGATAIPYVDHLLASHSRVFLWRLLSRSIRTIRRTMQKLYSEK